MSIRKISSCGPRQRTIAVLGMGHVGLPTAVAFSEMGWRVIGADNDAAKVALMNSGQAPFYEPGLQELLRKQLKSTHFEVTTRVGDAIRAASVVFISVGTPQAEDGGVDLRGVEALARTIASNLNTYKLIVEKSTVPAITGQWIRKTIERELAASGIRSHSGSRNGNGNGNGDGTGNKKHPTGSSTGEPSFEVASNPEFLQEGKAIENLFHPDRVVCGVTSDRSRKILTELYSPLNCPILFTDLNTAELIKHTANAFLAMKISFINLVADLCDAVGADVRQVANGIGLDRRIGNGFLEAGIGFGGYCLPKDLRALIHLAEERNVRAALLREVEAINCSRVDRVVQKIREALWIVPGKTIAVLGLSFKAGTDDVRESPSLSIVKALAHRGAMLRLYDPRAMDNARQVVPEEAGRIVYCDDPYDTAESADALVILTEWSEFRTLDLARLRSVMKVPVLVDGRNLFDPEVVRSHGYEYICMGRSSERRWGKLGGKPDSNAIRALRPEPKPVARRNAVAVGTVTGSTSLSEEAA